MPNQLELWTKLNENNTLQEVQRYIEENIKRVWNTVYEETK